VLYSLRKHRNILPISLSLPLSACPAVFLSVSHSLHQTICLFVISPSFYLSISLCLLSLNIYQFVCLCLSIFPISQSVYVCLSVSPSVCPFIIFLSLCPALLSSICLSVGLYLYLSICLSNCLSIRPSIYPFIGPVHLVFPRNTNWRESIIQLTSSLRLFVFNKVELYFQYLNELNYASYYKGSIVLRLPLL
jgi:hypothetical protein